MLRSQIEAEPLKTKDDMTKASAVARKAISRRQRYAEQTREGILAAARELFCKRGYFSTTVDEITELAGVAPVTVYASTGGKSGLLQTLTETWSSAPIIESNYKVIVELNCPVEVLRVVASSARVMREEFGDIVVLMLATAPHDKDVSESLHRATAQYREAIEAVVRHLKKLEAADGGSERSTRGRRLILQ